MVGQENRGVEPPSGSPHRSRSWVSRTCWMERIKTQASARLAGWKDILFDNTKRGGPSAGRTVAPAYISTGDSFTLETRFKLETGLLIYERLRFIS
eukprot:7377822-Prymnesium_polylepis.1